MTDFLMKYGIDLILVILSPTSAIAFGKWLLKRYIDKREKERAEADIRLNNKLVAMHDEIIESRKATLESLENKLQFDIYVNKNALRAILRDRIVQSCNFYIQREWLTILQLQTLEALYRSYEELGGNGFCKTLYQRVSELELRANETVV